jgi:hypothetical protein
LKIIVKADVVKQMYPKTMKCIQIACYVHCFFSRIPNGT